jgi:tripartite-type tricarboxylate transporter receptor subunit TctC
LPKKVLTGACLYSHSVIDKLNNAVDAALKDSEVIAKLKQQGVTVIGEGPEALARRIQQEIVFYDGLLPSIGIQAE